jgi:hypothetical protein
MLLAVWLTVHAQKKDAAARWDGSPQGGDLGRRSRQPGRLADAPSLQFSFSINPIDNQKD